MARYRVVGTRTVDGVKPGDVLTVAEDTPLNVAALLAAGHLEPLTVPSEGGSPTRTAKAKGGDK